MIIIPDNVVTKFEHLIQTGTKITVWLALKMLIVHLRQFHFGNSKLRSSSSVAVVGLFVDDRLPPAEQEVADCCADHDGRAQPRVVRHKDEHEQVRESHLTLNAIFYFDLILQVAFIGKLEHPC